MYIVQNKTLIEATDGRSRCDSLIITCLFKKNKCLTFPYSR